MTTRLRQMKVAHEPPGHPCHALEPSACHGDGSPELATPGRARHAETSRAFEGKAPLANLCNRLVVNEHPLDLPTLGRWALACSPTAFPLSPPTCALAQAAMIEPSTVTSDSRKRQSPTPSGDAVGAASPVVPVLPSLPEGCPEHRARAGPTLVCSTSREPRWRGDRRSLSRPLPAAAVAVAFVGSRGSFRRPTPSTPSSGSGAPSADESFAPPTPACAGAAGTKTATGTSAWPPQPSFRHAFTRRYALDTLASLAGFAFPLGLASSPLAVRARGPRAARRLQQL